MRCTGRPVHLMKRTYVKKVDGKGYPWVEQKVVKKDRRKGDLEMFVPEDWYKVLEGEFTLPYFSRIEDMYRDQVSMYPGRVYPPLCSIFTALELCPYAKVSVVILGQDPYCKFGQANGLSFGVAGGKDIPPSLQNIFMEIKRDFKDSLGVDTEVPFHGDLSEWSKQGVLLLNTHLTVTDGQPLSHKDWGWDIFTAKMIETISSHQEDVVFMLWGAEAKSKSDLIDETKHLVLRSSHPSPKSCTMGFQGCGHFVKCNQYLAKHGKSPIEWLKIRNGIKVNSLFA